MSHLRADGFFYKSLNVWISLVCSFLWNDSLVFRLCLNPWLSLLLLLIACLLLLEENGPGRWCPTIRRGNLPASAPSLTFPLVRDRPSPSGQDGPSCASFFMNSFSEDLFFTVLCSLWMCLNIFTVLLTIKITPLQGRLAGSVARAGAFRSRVMGSCPMLGVEPV